MHINRYRWLVSIILALSCTAAGQSNFSIGLNFTAVDRGEIQTLFNGNFTRTPAPDVNGAVGPNHVVLFIKGVYRVFDKTTGAMVSQLDDVSFWNQTFTNNGLTYQTVQTRGPSDPRMLFDVATNRWYAVGIDQTGTNNGVLNIAVTNGPDPTAPGSWRGFTYAPAPGQGWPDFPTVGINNDGLMICSAIFSAAGSYRGSRISQLPSSGLTALSPGASGAATEALPAFIANPTISQTGAAGPMPVIAPSNSGASAPAGPEAIAYNLLRPPLSLSGGNAAPQPEGAAPITVIADRITSNVLLHNGEIWGAHDASGRVHWFRLNAATGAPIEQGDIAVPDLHLFFPSLALNSVGDLVIGMNGSSGEQFVSSFAVAGKTAGGVTTFGDVQLLKAGVDTYTVFDGAGRNRWGDYSTTVADPTNSGAFWTFQEYVAADRTDPLQGFIDNNRAIQITQIFVPEPGAGITALIIIAILVRRCHWRITTCHAVSTKLLLAGELFTDPIEAPKNARRDFQRHLWLLHRSADAIAGQ